MSYALEWIPCGVVFGTMLILLIVPEFAVIGVLVVELVALAAAALASPYLLGEGRERLP